MSEKGHYVAFDPTQISLRTRPCRQADPAIGAPGATQSFSRGGSSCSIWSRRSATRFGTKRAEGYTK